MMPSWRSRAHLEQRETTATTIDLDFGTRKRYFDTLQLLTRPNENQEQSANFPLAANLFDSNGMPYFALDRVETDPPTLHDHSQRLESGRFVMAQRF
jgi:hypothetical protein